MDAFCELFLLLKGPLTLSDHFGEPVFLAAPFPDPLLEVPDIFRRYLPVPLLAHSRGVSPEAGSRYVDPGGGR